MAGQPVTPRTALFALLACTACHARPADKSVQPADSASSVDSGTPAPATVPAGTSVLAERDLYDAISGALEVADTRVRLAQYTLWDSGDASRLLEAVEDAARRGVSVQVLADEEADDTEAWLARLADAGAETALDSPDVTLHTKLWIIDDVAYTGSHNLSDSALSSNREVSARLTDPDAVAAFDAWFDGVWADSTATPSVPALPGNTRPVFDRDVLPAVLDCFHTADDRIRVAMYAFAWSAEYPGGEVDQILQALVQANQRGVDVKVVLDGSAWITDHQINDDAIVQLQAGGVDVRTADRSEVLHAKALVCDNSAFISDANWSYSGLALYHGASVHIIADRLADDLAAWIDALHAAGTG